MEANDPLLLDIFCSSLLQSDIAAVNWGIPSTSTLPIMVCAFTANAAMTKNKLNIIFFISGIFKLDNVFPVNTALFKQGYIKFNNIFQIALQN